MSSLDGARPRPHRQVDGDGIRRVGLREGGGDDDALGPAVLVHRSRRDGQNGAVGGLRQRRRKRQIGKQRRNQGARQQQGQRSSALFSPYSRLSNKSGISGFTVACHQ